MKKLLALSLVLGMVALANAGIFITVNGVDAGDLVTANLGEILTIGVANDPAADQYNAILILGTADMAKGAWTGDSAVLKNIGEATGWSRMFDPGIGDAWVGMFAQPITTSIAAGITGTVGYQAINGAVVLTLTDDSLTFIDAVTIMTPEPMTMVLLGLGGLFLRKKK